MKDGDKRTALIELTLFLAAEGKLNEADVTNGVWGILEFLDDIVIDVPKARDLFAHYAAQLLAAKVPSTPPTPIPSEMVTVFRCG